MVTMNSGDTERVVFTLQKLVNSASIIAHATKSSPELQELLVATETLTKILLTSDVAREYFADEIADIRETIGFVPGSVVYLTELGYGQRTGTIVSTDYHREIYVLWDQDRQDDPDSEPKQCEPSTLTLMPHE